jgi:hypothetical protein
LSRFDGLSSLELKRKLERAEMKAVIVQAALEAERDLAVGLLKAFYVGIVMKDEKTVKHAMGLTAEALKQLDPPPMTGKTTDQLLYGLPPYRFTEEGLLRPAKGDTDE